MLSKRGRNTCDQQLIGYLAISVIVAFPIAIEVYGCIALATLEHGFAFNAVENFILAHVILVPFLMIFMLLLDHEEIQHWLHRWRIGTREQVWLLFWTVTALVVGNIAILTTRQDARSQHWIGIYVCYLVIDVLVLSWTVWGLYIMDLH